MSVYCSQNHENPPDSRFCRLCGEGLALSNGSAGKILDDRYQILREIGHGGFGRTYLAEDTRRFHELCVLKEFAPQVQSSQALQKAESLFEREASVLYQLQHPQIPRFRESFRAELHGQKRLFLVQDYIEGKTYQALLSDRRLQGRCFSEAEVTQLLIQVLPILEYIHAQGVIHRDIAPDNLIQRAADGLPVLIDFGGVKQIAAKVASEFASSPASTATRLGKVDYAPPEQMKQGIVSPNSDLYALAVTVLVLLTDKEPQMLVDQRTLEWNWHREVQLSYALGRILDRMLAARPSDRFPSATDILQAIHGYHGYSPDTVQPIPNQPIAPRITPTSSATVVVAPLNPPSSSARVFTQAPSPKQSLPWWGYLSGLVVILLVGLLGWQSTLEGLKKTNDSPDPSPPAASVSPSPSPEPEPSSPSPSEKQAPKKWLKERCQALEVDCTWYSEAFVDDIFYRRHPNLKGRPLTTEPEDAELSKEWNAIASKWLDWWEDNLDPQNPQNLQNYGKKDPQRWREAVNARNLNRQALYDLADAEFHHHLPEYKGEKSIKDLPVEPIWWVITEKQVAAIESGQVIEKLQFDRGSINDYAQGTLQPGQGKAYIANLREGQLMRVTLTLEEPESDLQLSIHPPDDKTVDKTVPLLEDSRDRSWSGRLPKSGYYSFVVVGTGSDPVNYQLHVIVEDAVPTSEPTPPPEPGEKTS